ncbi:MAG: propionate CoA-transferase [Azorhizobium sp. 39-67-5]|nr:MAG: propionate CoA-transferase [Azorhizobium sp. 39-67-5]
MSGPASKVCSVEQAVSVIRDGDTIASVGVIGWLVPDALLAGIGRRFHAGEGCRDLAFYFPVGVGDALDIRGMEHVAVPGLMRRVISGNLINPLNPRTGRRPELMRLINDNLIEAYTWPIGATMHWLREVARRGPGYLTEIGLGTFIDPRHEGGRLNARTTEDLVRVCAFEGRDYLFYPTFPLNVGLLRASAADELGNLSFDGEPLHSCAQALALAVKASGGTVIAQVKEIVPAHGRPAASMQVPRCLVDHIVVEPEPMMTTDVAFDHRYLGGGYDPEGLGMPPFGIDKVIARRAALECREDEVSIFGFGAATDIPLILAEQGRFADGGIDRFLHTTEHGAFGGIVMSGWQFSANLFPEALIDGPAQFDFIDGGNCPFAALSFAQFDAAGNINVSKFSGYSPGSGGFIDIASNARRLVFAGTFTTGGLKVDFAPTGLKVAEEGRIRKFVGRAQQITYPLARGIAERGQEARIITERAVFDVDRDGPVLIEIADGIDIERDIQAHVEFGPVRVSADLKAMPADLFQA